VARLSVGPRGIDAHIVEIETSSPATGRDPVSRL
jgi:hypothetical protein